MGKIVDEFEFTLERHLFLHSSFPFKARVCLVRGLIKLSQGC